MKEYDLFIPLYYNDGQHVEPRKFQVLQHLMCLGIAEVCQEPVAEA